jgi:hypothetical protein
LVTDSCCNPAADGPRFHDQKCCYTFCPGPCCGRPFLIDGHARVAPLERTEEWLSRDLTPLTDIGALNAHTAQAIREAWLADAQMEHASVAAFGRFMLQLIALGAPARMVRDAALAAEDEVTHAELCFSIAACIGGVALGPMPLAIHDAFGARTLGEVITEVVHEGCVGETIAAVIASRQLEEAREPAIRQVLERISADEARHAELAFRFLRWAIDIGGEEARARAADAFAAALRDWKPSSEPEGLLEGDVDAPVLRAYGRLSTAERDETARRALVEIVAPCARALVERRQGRPLKGSVHDPLPA